MQERITIASLVILLFRLHIKVDILFIEDTLLYWRRDGSPTCPILTMHYSITSVEGIWSLFTDVVGHFQSCAMQGGGESLPKELPCDAKHLSIERSRSKGRRSLFIRVEEGLIKANCIEVFYAQCIRYLQLRRKSCRN